MKTLQFIYNNESVDFSQGENNNVMVNATQMAKIFGKRVDNFLKSDHANEFIKVLELTPFGGRSTTLTKDEIIKKVNGVNTWMHRVLALKFAAWLDPQFELWVYSTIDSILLGCYYEQKQATKERLQAEKELQIKKQELLNKYPEFLDFLDLENKVSNAEKRRIQAVRSSVKQLKLDLFQE